MIFSNLADSTATNTGIVPPSVISSKDISKISSTGIVPPHLQLKQDVMRPAPKPIGIVPPILKEKPSGIVPPQHIQSTLPPGSIQWFGKDGKWHYAVPKKTKTSTLSGYSAVSPVIGYSALGETHTEVGTGNVPMEGVDQVDEDTGKKATLPIWKKWWFWGGISVVLLGVLVVTGQA